MNLDVGSETPEEFFMGADAVTIMKVAWVAETVEGITTLMDTLVLWMIEKVAIWDSISLVILIGDQLDMI